MKPIVRHLEKNAMYFSGMFRSSYDCRNSKYVDGSLTIGGYIWMKYRDDETSWKVYCIAANFKRLEVKICFEI